MYEDDVEVDEVQEEGLGVTTCSQRCTDCILYSKFDRDEVGFTNFETVGTNPRILFCGEAPGQEEIKQGRPFVGKAGSFFREELQELGLTSYYMANAMGCHPRSGKIRTPEFEEVKFCSKNVKQFINQNKPDLVIMLGRSAYEALMEPDFYKGKSVTAVTKQKPIEIDGIKYAAAFHPSYITRNGGKKSPQYDDFIERLRLLITGGNIKETVPTVPFELKNLDDLDQVLLSYIKETDLGFDYEGISLSPFSKDFRILGFSLAALHPARATYVDFHRPITDKEKLKLSMFLNNKKPWTYNVNYELKVTWANVSNKFIPFNDAYILCKMDCSPGRLKDNARKHVGADYWEELLGSIKEMFTEIFKKTVKIEKEITTLKNKTSLNPAQEEALKSLQSLHSAIVSGQLTDISSLLTDDKNLVKHAKILEDINELYKFCDEKQVSRGLSKYPNEWEAIPVEITGEYCCYDSYYTLLLKNHLWDKHKSSYEYYITQAWVGSVMETYGMNWNDEVASQYESYYIAESVNCLYSIIQKLDFGPGSTTIQVNEKTGKEKEIIVKSTDELRLDAYSIMHSNEIEPVDKLKQLKLIFNPMSNKREKQDPFWKVYTTGFVTAISMFYILEESILASSVIPNNAVKLIDKKDLNTTVRNLITYDWTKESTPENIITDVQSRRIKNQIEKMIGELSSKVEEHLGKFNAEVIEWQFRAHKKYGGLFTVPSKDSDLEPEMKPETEWVDEFRLLYLLRRFKKVTKSITTYINGKVGRKQVWLSEVSDDYSQPPKRIVPYFNVEKGYKLKDNERWIIDTEYNVASANTHRWTSWIHTVPANSELREIYDSRRSDSMFMHYDASQAEIRLLAALAKDKALLDAFNKGLDVHRFIAAKMYNKPNDDPKIDINLLRPGQVTPVERKSAKAASFGLLYGKGIESFAAENMGGDIGAATKLFNDFYAGFPDVKIWIDQRHAEAEKTGKVTTIFGNTLILDMRDFNAAMRYAQNWPIQHGSSAIAAYSIYTNYNSAKSKNIPIIPMVFTHDSHDMEFNTPYLFEALDNIFESAVDMPKNKFDIPMQIDWEIGANQGESLHLKELSRDGTNSRMYKFTADHKALNESVVKLRKFFDVEYTIEKEEQKTSSLEEMFLPKKAFSKYLGIPKNSISGKVKITKRELI